LPATVVFVVIYFAVEDDDAVARLVVVGLMAPLQVDDAEASHPESYVPVHVQALVVGPAVAYGVEHPLDALRIHRVAGVPVNDSGDAAHGVS
jgi:hypothetical protein